MKSCANCRVKCDWTLFQDGYCGFHRPRRKWLLPVIMFGILALLIGWLALTRILWPDPVLVGSRMHSENLPFPHRTEGGSGGGFIWTECEGKAITTVYQFGIGGTAK